MTDPKCPACIQPLGKPPECYVGRPGCVRADPHRETPAFEKPSAGADVPDGIADIVEELRQGTVMADVRWPGDNSPPVDEYKTDALMAEAAAEIARLRAEVEKDAALVATLTDELTAERIETADLRSTNRRLMAIIGPKVHCKSCGTVVPTTGPEAWDCDCMDADEVPRTPKFMAHDEAACNHVARLRAEVSDLVSIVRDLAVEIGDYRDRLFGLRAEADRAALAQRVAEAVREAVGGSVSFYRLYGIPNDPATAADEMRRGIVGWIKSADLAPIVAAALAMEGE
jgi:hypothetical protein